MTRWAVKARGRSVLRQPGAMNKLEAIYAQELELRRRAGDVLWFEFDAVKLRLAGSTFYTPDFFVMLADGSLEVHEVKGHWEDDARVKIKVAADKFPFRFLAVSRAAGAWRLEEF
jgi:hypothetical protein